MGQGLRGYGRCYVNVVAKKEWPPVKGKHAKAWRQYMYYSSIGWLHWGAVPVIPAVLEDSCSNKRRLLMQFQIDVILHR
jgi:hypothetical protein